MTVPNTVMAFGASHIGSSVESGVHQYRFMRLSRIVVPPAVYLYRRSRAKALRVSSMRPSASSKCRLTACASVGAGPDGGALPIALEP